MPTPQCSYNYCSNVHVQSKFQLFTNLLEAHVQIQHSYMHIYSMLHVHMWAQEGRHLWLFKPVMVSNTDQIGELITAHRETPTPHFKVVHI